MLDVEQAMGFDMRNAKSRIEGVVMPCVEHTVQLETIHNIALSANDVAKTK